MPCHVGSTDCHVLCDAASTTVFWGPGLLFRYEDVAQRYGIRHELRLGGPRPHPTPSVFKPAKPLVEWQQGDPATFSGAGGMVQFMRDGELCITPVTEVCAHCRRQLIGKRAKCRCGGVYYCDVKCQAEARPMHKRECKARTQASHEHI